MLRINFTRLSPSRHQFAYARPDGAGESVTLETRSLLVHDLVHFVFETEANLKRSFYGLLAEGFSLADVNPERDRFPNEEARLTERIVGPLTGVMAGRATPGDFLEGFARWRDAMGEPAPDWLTHDLVTRTAKRFRAVHGHWKATPFRGTLNLQFNPGAAS